MLSVFPKMYVSFDHELTNSRHVAGGKATAMARLREQGVPVPPFFVVLPGALHQIAEGKELLPLLTAPPSAFDGERLREAIRRVDISHELHAELSKALADLLGSTSGGLELVAVRSSAAQEDGADASFAGQFTSVLGVRPQCLDAAIKECWSSYFSARAMAYRSYKARDGSSLDFSVVVQNQLIPDKAGVLFTRHPLFPDQADRCHVEANFGSGESVVAGVATPDSYTCKWPTGELLDQRVSTKRRMSVVWPDGGAEVIDVPADRQTDAVLSEDELDRLVELGVEVERLLKGPQDIEWAIVGSSSWILQSRPITYGKQRKELA